MPLNHSVRTIGEPLSLSDRFHPIDIFRSPKQVSLYSTRNVEAFLEKTAIAYRQNLALFLENGWYAIAVFSKNASTLPVQ